MRRLLILRHARAVPLSREDDFDRVLAESGRDDARRLGVYMADGGYIPDLALYSGAARTRETYAIVSAEWRRPVEARAENAIYEATRFLILGLLRELPASARAALIVGHNPGMADIANLLTGEGASAERLRLASKFPTCALAVIAFDRPDWSELAPHTGRLETFVTPQDF